MAKIAGVTKADMFFVDDPKKIAIVEGFNHRLDFSGDKSLVESIIDRGVDTPLHVRKNRGDTEVPYSLIAGERRLRAITEAHAQGHTDIRIPIIVKRGDEMEAFIDSAVENIERKSLNAVEESNVVTRMEGFGFSTKEIAFKFHRSEQWVRDRKLLSEAHSEVKAAVVRGKIPSDVGINLVRNQPQDKQPKALKKIVDESKGDKKKARKAAAKENGKVIRPGARALSAMLEQVRATPLPEETKEPLLAALEWMNGELDESELLAYIDNLTITVN